MDPASATGGGASAARYEGQGMGGGGRGKGGERMLAELAAAMDAEGCHREGRSSSEWRLGTGGGEGRGEGEKQRGIRDGRCRGRDGGDGGAGGWRIIKERGKYNLVGSNWSSPLGRIANRW